MIRCAECDRLIMDYYEDIHLVVKEMDTPDKAYILCDECFNGS